MAIKAGTLLEVTTASGALARMRATGSPVQGRDFPVVWVCTEDEYERSRATGEAVTGIPWPLDSAKELTISAV